MFRSIDKPVNHPAVLIRTDMQRRGGFERLLCERGLTWKVAAGRLEMATYCRLFCRV